MWLTFELYNCGGRRFKCKKEKTLAERGGLNWSGAKPVWGERKRKETQEAFGLREKQRKRTHQKEEK